MISTTVVVVSETPSVPSSSLASFAATAVPSESAAGSTVVDVAAAGTSSFAAKIFTGTADEGSVTSMMMLDWGATLVTLPTRPASLIAAIPTRIPWSAPRSISTCWSKLLGDWPTRRPVTDPYDARLSRPASANRSWFSIIAFWAEISADRWASISARN